MFPSVRSGQRRFARVPEARAAFLAILAILALGGTAPVALGEPSAREQLKQTKSRVQQLSEQLTGSRQEFDRLGERVESSRLAEARIEDQLVLGERRLERIGKRLNAARVEAQLAAQRLEDARQRLAGRLVAIYQSGSSDAMAILLSTEDFGDLAASGAYLEAIAESERDLANRVADLRRQRVEAVESVSQSRSEMAEQLSGLRSARSTIVATRIGSQQAAARLAALQRDREEKIEELKADVDEIESRIATTEGAANFAGGPYAIPTYIVMCESGGNYSALNPSSGAGGAYQIIPSTWEAYGGTGLPHLAPKAEQDRIASLIWENDGPGAWVCA